MADLYAEMKLVVDQLLSPTSQGGLGQVGVRIARRVEVTPENSWDMPTYTTVFETLKAAAKGVSKQMVGAFGINGVVIVGTDLEITCAVPLSGIDVGDTIEVNGKAVTLLLLRALPAAGPPVGYKLIVRT